MRVSMITPLINEEEAIPSFHENVKSVLESIPDIDYEIIYVDDDSDDNTLSILEDIQSKDNKVVVLNLSRRFGQTAAITAGFDFARGDVIITMDGDLQSNPEDIPRILKKSKDYDLVSGWRKKRRDPLFSRRIPSLLGNWLIRKVTGVKLHDYGCQMKSYRRDIIKNLRLYGEMHRFIPVIANWYGIKVGEIETYGYPRTRGKTRHGLIMSMREIFNLLTVKFLLSFSTRPIQFFGPLGLSSTALGLLLSIYLVFRKIIYPESVNGGIPLLLAALFIFVGIQFIAMGLMSEILVRIYHESQRKPIYVVKRMIASENR